MNKTTSLFLLWKKNRYIKSIVNKSKKYVEENNIKFNIIKEAILSSKKLINEIENSDTLMVKFYHDKKIIKIMNERHFLVYYKILLNNIPDEISRIRIDNFRETLDKTNIKDNEYYVDYKKGIVTFHPNNLGKEIIVLDYYGKAQIYTKYRMR